MDHLKTLKTPVYVVDERLLIKNLETLKGVMDRTGCKILLAQKGFSMYSTYPVLSEYLSGATSRSLNEVRLRYEEMGKETHVFAPAYLDSEFVDIMKMCGHIVFNSAAQWYKYRDIIKNSGLGISCGLRVNPEYSEVETEMYDPCAKHSRFGIKISDFEGIDLEGISGLHFHTMCEQNSDVLERTIKVFEEKFGKYLNQMKWVNFGGGHHITRDDYDIETLINCIMQMKSKYNVQVYLEPGEAVALNTGFLVSTVLDIIKEDEMDLAIIDASAACHMPDVLEMPYRPFIISSGLPGEKAHTYRLGGNTCLSGDVIGDYSFDEKLKVGDKLVFCDMAHYSMVKNNTFNGINLPNIAFARLDGNIEIVKTFGYEDFKGRL